MKFNMIVRSLALAGILGSISLPLRAVEAPKDATAPTQQANNALYNQLPFSDNTDFTNAHKGFIAPLPQEIIKGSKEIPSGIRNNILLLKKVIKLLIRLTRVYGVNLS